MERLQRLLAKAHDLPLTPGVYLMKDKNGNIIYVGKSKALHNRVSSYFQKGTGHNLKTQRMVSQVEDFDYMLTHTEIEALSLENKLIKLHKPKYNILLKDDKSYPYIKVTTGEEYPGLQFVRKRSNDRARYFGPYSGATTAVSIIRTAQKTFGIPRCKKVFPRDIGKGRPCLYYQLGQCCGLCTGRVEKKEYYAKIKDLLTFLGGDFGEVKKSLTEKMLYASDNLLFEAAGKYRDNIRELDALWEKQKVVGAPDTMLDVISCYTDELVSCIVVFYIRHGTIVDKESFLFGANTIIDRESLCSFVCELYNNREFIPKNIMLDIELDTENVEMIEGYLFEKAGSRVNIKFPKRGDYRSLCDMARENAKQYALQYKAQGERDNKMLIKLASILQLEVVPENIEAYDISNFGADNITGGMISVIDANFKKKNYRTYKIRETDGKPDDYFSMRQTVERRLSHTELAYPDLILLDGGKGHVGVIKDLLRELNIDIPVFGMVKDGFHKTRAMTTENEEISIAREQSVFQFIYKIQEEVHRYTIGAMSRAKAKGVSHSSLEKIDGIGAAKAKALLLHFKTVSNLKNAEIDEIARVKGISKKNADAVYNYFKDKEKE